jgi:flagellar basal body-associated protein FliL
MNTGSELILIVIGLALLVVIFVIFVKFFRQIMLALAATAILGIGAFALIAQGRATEETAKAAKTAATAATVASAGQTANTMMLAMLSGVLIVVTLVALGGAGYFFIRAKRIEAQANRDTRRNAGAWRSGPNALWGRADAPAVGNVSNDVWAPVLMGQMMGQLMALQQTFLAGQTAPPSMRRGRNTYAPPPALDYWQLSPGDTWESWTEDEEEGDLWAAKF